MAALRGVKMIFNMTTKYCDYIPVFIQRNTYARRLHYYEKIRLNSSSHTTNVDDENTTAPERNVACETASKLQLEEDELMNYPINRFPGKIHIIKDQSHEEDLGILHAINKLKHESVLGMDVEMTESFHANSFNKRNKKTRVVQIASETDAIVWQLKNSASLPTSLEYFLTTSILKVGHSISDDVILLKKEFNITSQYLFDTLPLAIQLNCKPLGLHALCAIFLGWRISKGLRTSNWNRDELSTNQIHYACTDAWASLLLYKEMKRYVSENSCMSPSPIESVNNILDKRLDTKRKRRQRHMQNIKARNHYDVMINIAGKIIE